MIDLLYSDDYLMVIDKPPGLVVTNSETTSVTTLEDILRTDFGLSQVDRGGIVHRLDKDTSGLMVVAKNETIKLQLQDQFKTRQIHKEYLALVHGWMSQGGVVEGDIGRNPGDREKFIVFDETEDGRAKEAVTKYQPLKLYKLPDQVIGEIFEEFNKIQMRKIYASNYPRFSLVLCQPLTGRTHQIRVHLKYIGYPIVGDSKYGGRKTSRLDNRWCKRQFLHARSLEFTHPVTGQALKFESNLPSDLIDVLNLLEEIKEG